MRSRDSLPEPQPSRVRRLAPLAIGVLLGLAAAWLLSSGGRDGERDSALRADVEALRGDLEAEQRARGELAARLARLETGLDRRGPSTGRFEAAPTAESDLPEELDEFADPAAGEIGGGADELQGIGADGEPLQPAFDEAALSAAGLPDREIDGLRDRWERYELDRLELNDRAMREGWFMTRRHRNEHAGLRTDFREEIGDRGYDAYLYATGQNNRVVVRDVLRGSAASELGLQTGDVVLSYDGERIFGTRDLQRATGAGFADEWVRLEISRDGRIRSVRVQRGPLGTMLHSASLPPDEG